MITIGKLYVETVEKQVRLCAKITIHDRSTVLWFGVEEQYAQYFTHRADPFVLAMLGTAMRRGMDIRCEDSVSPRLMYQLQTSYIPTLVGVERAKPVRIQAPSADVAQKNAGARATGFTGGVDSLYTIMRHTGDAVLPDFKLTHVTVMNVGAFKGTNYRKKFRRACEYAAGFAAEQGLELVCIDTNFNEALQTSKSVDGLHSFAGELPYRIFAAAHALSGLFSEYYLSSEVAFRQFTLYKQIPEEDISYFDLFTALACSTDNLRCHCVGGEASRMEKIAALSDWEPSYRWLHACFTAEGNCGVCRKCVMAQTVLYCLGKLERYRAVYDIEAFYQNREAFLTRALMHTGHPYEEGMEELLRKHVTVTPQMEQKARILEAAVRATDRYFKGKDTDVPFAWKGGQPLDT